MWANQDEDDSGNQTFGTVTSYMEQGRFTVCVRWDNGYQNQYRCLEDYKDVVPLKSDKTFKDLL